MERKVEDFGHSPMCNQGDIEFEIAQLEEMLADAEGHKRDELYIQISDLYVELENYEEEE